MHDSIRLVHDEESFLAFLAALRDDWKRDGVSWENQSFDAFFDAGVSWAEDSRDAPMLQPISSNPWRRCAEILWAGTRYE